MATSLYTSHSSDDADVSTNHQADDARTEQAAAAAKEAASNDGEIFFGVKDNVIIMRLVGDVRYTNCGALSKFVSNLLEDNPYERIVVDLRQASSIDSTNLGILAKIAKHHDSDKGSKPLLACDNADIEQVIESMGIHEVYELCINAETGCKVFNKIDHSVEGNEISLSKVMVDAHEELAQMNEKNRDEFKDVIEALKGG